MVTRALHARTRLVAPPDHNQPEAPAGVPPPATAPRPWYEAPEFRALSELRLAFMKGASAPAVAIRTPEGGAREAARWVLYELGHVLDELAHRTRHGSPGWCVVRASEHGPGRVVLDIAIEPIPDPAPARSAEAREIEGISQGR